MDLDLAVAFSRDNRERLASALARIDARILGPEGQVAAAPPTAELLGGGDLWFLATRHGKLDVIAASPGLDGFEGLRSRADEIAFSDLVVPVASRDDLIRMKQGTGRPQDAADVAFLKSLADDG